MDGNNKNACMTCGNPGYCIACGMGRGYMSNHILRWILGIIIITWIFTIGMKFGEFKAVVEMSSPYGYGNNMMFRVSPGMMSTQGVPVGTVGGSAGNVMFTTSSVPAGSVKTIEVRN